MLVAQPDAEKYLTIGNNGRNNFHLDTPGGGWSMYISLVHAKSLPRGRGGARNRRKCGDERVQRVRSSGCRLQGVGGGGNARARGGGRPGVHDNPVGGDAADRSGASVVAVHRAATRGGGDADTHGDVHVQIHVRGVAVGVCGAQLAMKVRRGTRAHFFSFVRTIARQ